MKIGNVELFTKKIIRGCDGRGDGDSPYLTRVSIWRSLRGSCYLHKFHRSDADDLHDHPWAFVSIILWRGYLEETEERLLDGTPVRVQRRYWQGSILYRPATWQHRVVLVDDRPAFTLVFTGAVARHWGFWVDHVWVPWREYFRLKGCKE